MPAPVLLVPPVHLSPWAARTRAAASVVGRHGLVAILALGGLSKFTAAEAAAIRPLVEHSPLLGWTYLLGSTASVSAGIGVIEIAIALLLVLHRWWPGLAIVGASAALGMFATTLSFLVTTPGVASDPTGFGFLVKDLFLLVVTLGALSESLVRRVERRSVVPRG